MQIVPTLLTSGLLDFERQFVRLLPWCKVFQIDIQDGVYVPSTTLTTDELEVFFTGADKTKLDIFRSAVFDFHLMERNYSTSLVCLARLTRFIHVRYIFLHTNFTRISNLDNLQICPVLSPEDTINKPFLGQDLTKYPAIQVMTIHPGPQGQSFMIGELEKVHKLRDLGYEGQIAIDGSVNEKSILSMLHMPRSYIPDMFCVGSYFSKAKDEEIEYRMSHLLKLVSSF